MTTKEFTEEQFNTVRDMIRKAHAYWGDYTDSGVTYAILEYLTPDPVDEAIKKAVQQASRRIEAIRAVHEILRASDRPNGGLRASVDAVDAVKPIGSWPARVSSGERWT